MAESTPIPVGHDPGAPVWVVVIPIVSMVLCTGAVAARLFTRIRFANRELFIEDWLIIGPAYICTMAAAVTIVIAANYGFGWHIDSGIRLSDIEKTMKTLYAIQIPLFIAAGAIRTSLIIFILRLSQIYSRTIHLLTTALLPITVIHVIAATFVSVFRCNPVRSLWDFNVPAHSCIHKAVGYILVSIGLAIDVAIFLLPAVLVIRLDMNRKKKLQSIVMFALGGGGCIVECLRFHQLYQAEISMDITYTFSTIMVSVFFQVVLGMLCSCAPAIKVFVASTFASKFRCIKYLISESVEDVHETDPTRNSPGVPRGSEGRSRDPESTPGSFYDDASASESMVWGSSADRIEMDTRSPGMGEDNKYENRTVVKERRIMDLKEVMGRLDNQETAALGVPSDAEGAETSRSESSSRTDEFQVMPVEWGRRL
ncbi:hypothetical protein TWF481_010731 [Arthrobotrys musiformis]|uniref:Rhodopsin domain-containing protein n=1 Tax=Arthrobotrys musiformis TaxID=47236 RepID=A0AAV9W1K8_9PEZI